MQTKKLEWIQALRAIAALMVLFFHMAPNWETSKHLSGAASAMRWGFSGVDIFFALSGFVVYRAAKDALASGNATAFLRHRLIRVYSGYWPVLLVFALVWVVVLHLPIPPAQKVFYSIFLLSGDITKNWLAVSWTLALELYFYAWIFVLALMNRSKPHIPVAIGFLSLIAWHVGWLIVASYRTSPTTQPLRFLLTPYAIEFFLGALISVIHGTPKRHSNEFAVACVCIGLCFIGLGFVVGTTSPSFTNTEILRVGSFGIVAVGFLIVFLSLELTTLSPPKWLVKIGDASYSLYLLHTSLLTLIAAIGYRIFRYNDSQALLVLYLLLLPVPIVIISLYWYRFVERPVLKYSLLKFG